MSAVFHLIDNIQTVNKSLKTNSMKTVKAISALLFTMMFVLLTGFSSYAIKPTAMAPAESIQKMIKESLKYPEEAIKTGTTGTVDVTFKINDEGQIVIRKITADSKVIADAVEDQLADICCKGIRTPYNQYYKVTITFKLI